MWFRRFLTAQARSLSVPQQEPAEDLRPDFAGDGNNAFAFALHAELRKQTTGNVLFSPFCIRSAVAMAYAGAKGATAAEIRSALCFPTDDDAVHSPYRNFVQRLPRAARDEHEMTLANSLWVQDGATIDQTFVALLQQFYGDCIQSADFRTAAESARATINAWVEARTNRKIRDLIAPNSLNPDAGLVIVNAASFKGMWLHPFDAAVTRDEPFFLDDGAQVRAPLMHQHDDFWYVETNDFQAIELLYRGGDLSMLILLPTRRDGARQLEKTLSIQMLNDSVGRMRSRAVNLVLPRFTISSAGTSVRDHLETLGMTLAFDQSTPDFSGINGQVPPDPEALFVSDVVHKTLVEVDEKGTEAATLMDRKPPVIFRADHPFVFAIRDRMSGALLFLGRLMDPARAS